MDFFLNSEITGYLTDDTIGLLPFLTRNLATPWDGFRIEPWNFTDTKAGEAGFTFGDMTTIDQGGEQTLISIEVNLGFMIVVEGELNAQVRAFQLALEIDKYVRKWACCTQDFAGECIEKITGGMPVMQNQEVDATNVNSWYCFIIRRPTLIIPAEGHNGADIVPYP